MTNWALLLGVAGSLVVAQAAAVVLDDVTLIDGTGSAPRTHVSIVIDDGRIIAVAPAGHGPKSAHVIALSGKTVMPGIINAHGHLGLNHPIEQQVVQYQRYGVTRMMSLGLNDDSLYRFRRQGRPGAVIMTADRGFGADGGVPPEAMSKAPYRPRNADEARRDVSETALRHPDLIKLWLDDGMGKAPKMKPEIYAAIIDEAHANKLKVAAHVFYLDDAKQLVRDGVDILAHSIRDKPVDDELIALMKQHGTFYIPTLQLEEAFFIYSEHPAWMDSAFYQDSNPPAPAAQAAEIHRQNLETAKENLRRLYQAGAAIGFGTDSGAFPNRIPGFAEQRELYLMVRAGMPPLAAIHSATGGNARMLGIESSSGTVQPGRDADLLVLDGNPAGNIANTTRLLAVWQHGVEVVPMHANPGLSW
jgi:imidazolonepropionase-like amidohydrolase